MHRNFFSGSYHGGNLLERAVSGLVGEGMEDGWAVGGTDVVQRDVRRFAIKEEMQRQREYFLGLLGAYFKLCTGCSGGDVGGAQVYDVREAQTGITA